MKDYSQIQFQLDLSREEMTAGKPHVAMDALIQAFRLVKKSDDVRFRQFALEIWNATEHNMAMLSNDEKVARQARFLKAEIDTVSRERNAGLILAAV